METGLIVCGGVDFTDYAMLRFAGQAQAQVAAFWNGKSRGTADMIALAEHAGVLCRIWLYRTDAGAKA